MTSVETRALGVRGEELAQQYLRRQGMQILQVNWRCPRGEIDIVAEESGALVFCEVKTRTTTAFGDPVEAVDFRKSRRLRALAATWMSEQSGRWRSVRFDVVGVLASPDGTVRLKHVRDAF